MSLDDIEALRQLKARYFRTLDAKDWDSYEGVFAEDLIVDVTSTPSCTLFHGRDAFLAYMRETFAEARTVHHGHMPEITLTSDTTATGIWSMEDWVDLPDGQGELNGHGHYFEKYEKVNGNWYIKELVLTRLRLSIQGKTQWPPLSNVVID